MHELSRLLIGLALIGLALGQTGARLHAASFMLASSHDHAAAEHSGGHTHEHPAPGNQDHSEKACVTACCIGLSNWSQPAGLAERVHFTSTVLYGELAQSVSGRSEAPEPGIPKHFT